MSALKSKRSQSGNFSWEFEIKDMSAEILSASVSCAFCHSRYLVSSSGVGIPSRSRLRRLSMILSTSA